MPLREVTMTLDALRFDNAWARLPDDFFTRVSPTTWKNTRLVDISPHGCRMLGLDTELFNDDSPSRETLRQVLGGETVLPGMDPLAQKYTGHQFGVYNPALGDGRGLLLGEVATDDGFWDLHLKGAGQTPYSRFGDGRAVLRSTIREYLAGEAMAGLGIPTTLALALAVNDEKVQRERVEPGATLLRLAPSHVRFGHFEWLYQARRNDDLRRLVEHVITRHRPALAECEAPTEALFGDTVARTARLIAAWQAYGFVHAVMNTDNMSILGLTLDYGPYAFMDRYEPTLVPNHTDTAGRYAFDQQPGVGLWNLSVLGQSLTPLADPEALRAQLAEYEPALQQEYARLMRARLGLEQVQEGDAQLVQDWLTLLADAGADYHRAFRALGEWAVDDGAWLHDEVPAEGLAAWLSRYRQRLDDEPRDDASRREAMQSVNPLYVPRTHLIQQVIEAAEKGDMAPLAEFRALLADPFTSQPGMAHWAAAPAPEASVICLSCSS
ncbi:protein adenylyltransferase SelO [Chromohalobacter sp. HP20-39]|uniref:protein adenylyltransferase SelO n=1 Tax=Chromohalobacter sp. HP20-39 TaxID=3079306 RepID=UPI00294AE522|nr:YdiU family protein [Chromohalobacter sp. HP20-39]MDV6317458.1 YdiU family protein [Chromohalobacter sp. HP20-39]